MTAADIELARMIYLASSLGAVLFASILLRAIHLWRPLRFLLLALLVSFLFTPFFIDQTLPDGSQQNMVPAFVVLAHDGVKDMEHWQENIRRAGSPIAVVAGINCVIALVLAWLLPKPAKPVKRAKLPPENNREERPVAPKKRKKKHNPYLPEDFQPQ